MRGFFRVGDTSTDLSFFSFSTRGSWACPKTRTGGAVTVRECRGRVVQSRFVERDEGIVGALSDDDGGGGEQGRTGRDEETGRLW